MVESGHRAEIRPVDFTSRRHPDLPVEAVKRSELLARFDPGHFARPERVSFAALLLVRDGLGRHDVDFETIPLRPGRVVEVRPGQVHRWHMEDGVLVLRSVRIDYRLELEDEHRGAAEEVHEVHAGRCPNARSVSPSITIETELEVVDPVPA
jgi:quercetin dioxygenase-like cupin family protein